MASDSIVHVDDGNFDAEVLKSSVPVLVDFWAEWCGPCLMLAPTMDDLAREYQGKVKVAKCDVDKAQQLAANYGVQNIPTVLLFQNGQQRHRLVGAKQKREYKALLDQMLAG